MKNKRLLLVCSLAGIGLLIPLLAMQFTDEVNWTLLDFLVAGVLLFGTALIVELILKKVKIKKYRLLLCLAVLLFMGLLWAELAVGIFT